MHDDYYNVLGIDVMVDFDGPAWNHRLGHHLDRVYLRQESRSALFKSLNQTEACLDRGGSPSHSSHRRMALLIGGFDEEVFNNRYNGGGGYYRYRL